MPLQPVRQYGSGGMRADGYDAEDTDDGGRGARGPAVDARARSRLRAQGRLDGGY